MNYDLKAFSKKLKKHLDEERYVHTLGAVSYTHLDVYKRQV